jgi:hypothetical protein
LGSEKEKGKQILFQIFSMSKTDKEVYCTDRERDRERQREKRERQREKREKRESERETDRNRDRQRDRQWKGEVGNFKI